MTEPLAYARGTKSQVWAYAGHILCACAFAVLLLSCVVEPWDYRAKAPLWSHTRTAALAISAALLMTAAIVQLRFCRRRGWV